MKLRDRRSILGVDPTKRGLAFVFFERGELIDWGMHTCSSDNVAALTLLDALVQGCAADVVVVEDSAATGCQRRARIRQLLGLTMRHLKRQHVGVVGISRAEVRDSWRRRGQSTKQTIAVRLADRFPELRHLVPPPRKVFMDEDERLQVFDALTLVLAAVDRPDSVER